MGRIYDLMAGTLFLGGFFFPTTINARELLTSPTIILWILFAIILGRCINLFASLFLERLLLEGVFRNPLDHLLEPGRPRIKIPINHYAKCSRPFVAAIRRIVVGRYSKDFVRFTRNEQLGIMVLDVLQSSPRPAFIKRVLRTYHFDLSLSMTCFLLSVLALLDRSWLPSLFAILTSTAFFIGALYTRGNLAAITLRALHLKDTS